jgi:hypothetical protein
MPFKSDSYDVYDFIPSKDFDDTIYHCHKKKSLISLTYQLLSLYSSLEPAQNAGVLWRDSGRGP